MHPLLLKYLPSSTSPRPSKTLRASSVDSNHRLLFPNSPCPSPTPVFQHLYFALSQWERCLSESPDYIKEIFHLSKNDGKPTDFRPRSNSMDSFYTTITDPEHASTSTGSLMRKSSGNQRRQSTPAAMPSMEFRSKRIFSRVQEQGESVDDEC